MRKRAAVVLALLVSLLGTSVPASAATPLTVSGRVLDETGHPVAGATVRGYADLHWEAEPLDGFGEMLFWGLGCAFSLGLACDRDRDASAVAVARTDRNGRYVLRFTSYDTSWDIVGGVVRGITVTAPTLVRGTDPATTSTSTAHLRRTTMPTLRLWLRGASADAVSPTRRRLRAGVPKVLGRPVRPAKVVLVQGHLPVWSYGEVARDRDVDGRVAERGTTGIRSTVTTTSGTMRVEYRSGVRVVTKTALPLSRGKRCYDGDVLLGRPIPSCPLTDGALGSATGIRDGIRTLVVDLEDLSVPEAYVVRDCAILSVATSIDGEVFLDVKTQQKERHVYTGKPDLPARYVRVQLDRCGATEVSVFGAPYELPVAGPVAALRLAG